MNANECIVADPWLKKSNDSPKLPDGGVFVCAYGLHLGVEIIEEAVFLERIRTRDGLWIAQGFDHRWIRYNATGTGSPGDPVMPRVMTLYRIGCAFAVRRKGDMVSAWLNLLERLIRARVGFEWPHGFVAVGIVDEPA